MVWGGLGPGCGIGSAGVLDPIPLPRLDDMDQLRLVPVISHWPHATSGAKGQMSLEKPPAAEIPMGFNIACTSTVMSLRRNLVSAQLSSVELNLVRFELFYACFSLFLTHAENTLIMANTVQDSNSCICGWLLELLFHLLSFFKKVFAILQVHEKETTGWHYKDPLPSLSLQFVSLSK